MNEPTNNELNSSLSDINEMEMAEIAEGDQHEADKILLTVSEESEEQRPTKRGRVDDEDEGWILQQKKDKKSKSEDTGVKIEIYISSENKMPKQLTLARIFKSEGITDINRVKYINPYKIRVDTINGNSAIKLENSKEISNRGWRIHRAMEVNFSYGVIKDIDIDMTEEEIVKNMSSLEPGEIVSVHRLNRRSFEAKGWTPSETIRICFKGSYRPPYVFVHGLRIRVDPYVFPVSQCYRCWKLGHTAKKCPCDKIVCPKCGGNHENCDTTVFKCVNCNGQHMAQVRSCKVYQKEKKLRDLMAEFNCSYQTARSMYVEVHHQQRDNNNYIIPTPTMSTKENEASTIKLNQVSSYADVTKNNNITTKTTPQNKIKLKIKSQKQTEQEDDFTFVSHITNAEVYTQKNTNEESEEKNEREVKFSELINRLKIIIFMKKDPLQVKVQNVVKCCLEWLVLMVVENIAEWPVLKLVYEYFLS